MEHRLVGGDVDAERPDDERAEAHCACGEVLYAKEIRLAIMKLAEHADGEQ